MFVWWLGVQVLVGFIAEDTTLVPKSTFMIVATITMAMTQIAKLSIGQRVIALFSLFRRFH